MHRVERHDEIISHFRCPACQGWWSISEFERQRRQQQTMPCPHCKTPLSLDSVPLGAQ